MLLTGVVHNVHQMVHGNHAVSPTGLLRWTLRTDRRLKQSPVIQLN